MNYLKISNLYNTGYLDPHYQQKIRIKQGLQPQNISNSCINPKNPKNCCIENCLYPISATYPNIQQIPDNCPCVRYLTKI